MARRYNDEREGSSRRGFASMDPEERREIGRRGAEARWGREYDDEDDDRESGGRWRGKTWLTIHFQWRSHENGCPLQAPACFHGFSLATSRQPCCR